MGHRIKKIQEQPDIGMGPTSLALLVGLLGGLGILFYGESLLGDIQGGGAPHGSRLANWQIHMGAICMGAAAFITILFLMELLSRQSKIAAWRISWPWLPLVGVTAVATFIHIPPYAVIFVCAIDTVWAYIKTVQGKG